MIIKKYLIHILILINIALVIANFAFSIYCVFFYDTEDNIESISNIPDSPLDYEEKDERKSGISVEVKGAVVSPGVYHFDENNIIDDLIKAAGGVNANAFTDNINLSKKLKDEMVVYVYTKYEYSILNKPKVEIQECRCPDVEISPCLNTGKSIITEGKTTDNNEDVVSQKININTATETEFTKLNGIGEAKAKIIVEYRNNNGLFSKIDDIKKVSGISDSLYEKIKNDITV